MTASDPIQAAVFQFDVKRGDVAANEKRVLSALDGAAENGASLFVLPEMWSCGFDYPKLAEHAKDTHRILGNLQKKAMEKKMVVTGSLPEAVEGSIYNTAFVVDADGSIAGKYRKIHLFTHGGEGKGFMAGDTPVVCDCAVGRIGLLICYDLRFPELARALVDKEAAILVVVAQWPLVRAVHWSVLLQARAIENQIFVVAANRCGADASLVYGGGSAIISPAGECLGSAGSETATLGASLDFSEMTAFRDLIPCLKERVPEVYTR